MAFELPTLPYADTALEPYYSAKTFSFHHGKHHNAYVDNLNKLLPGSPFENSTLEEMINAAETLGWSYLGIADHSHAATYANGLSPDRAFRVHPGCKPD